MKFLSIGECMLELAPDGPDRYASGFAGDTFNTVWYIARLADHQVHPIYLTAVGDDALSQEMVTFIRDAGIEPLVKRRVGKSVGLYMIALKDGERTFSYWRDSSAARTLAADLDPLPVADGDVVYFSGITLAILPDKDRAPFLEALKASRLNGAKIVFDPNLRPRLWADLAEMRDWTMKGAATADICLPSFEDEAAHFNDATPARTCDRYASNGSSIVVVKNGPDPITIYEGGQIREVEISTKPDVVDTTAAGDSFNAMLILRHLKGDGLELAARAASRLSAQVISQRGALVDIEDPDSLAEV